ncbi:DHS-like NAD/FAD-binding domain-containing protein [Ceratobasidium sp. AG-I]|nr:DHS-like NAD/FAD-binding domain-containing protein [Ceratobasidium sp. AG-I]
MVKISIPTLPASILSRMPGPTISLPEAVARVGEFMSGGKALVVTGAGVSVDSGIRAYRGKSGHYANPNFIPILYHELVDPTARGHSFRQRYWSRSYLGYPPVRDAQPNPTHYAIGALQLTGHVQNLITQNVDGLHHKAIPGSATRIKERILELHGTLHSVHCRTGHSIPREEFQDELSRLNPSWRDFMEEMARTGTEPRTNPDGDVDIRGVDFSNFVLPVCKTCLAQGIHDDILKPEVIFFGESIAPEVKQRSFEYVESSERVLFVGTTLATYSAFRLLKHAVELKKSVMLLNIGPTRGDDVAEVDKIEGKSSEVLRGAVRTLRSKCVIPVIGFAGSWVLTEHRMVLFTCSIWMFYCFFAWWAVRLSENEVKIVDRMLSSGVVVPPPEDGEGGAPRTAG